MTDFFKHCYEKHNFEELNNLDLEVFYKVLNFYFQRFHNDKDSVFIDVGSNSGSFIKQLFYCSIKENIHCFEPHPVLSKTTQEKYPYVRMNNYCLGNNDDTITVYFPIHSVGLSSIINRPVFAKLNQEILPYNVKCIKLDTYCELNNIDEISFLKIDVEGGEKTIFEGAMNLLKNHKIKCGMFEIGPTLTDAGTNEAEIVKILNDYGYQLNTTLDNNNYVFYLP
jgi:FkbM family methyltransferase